MELEDLKEEYAKFEKKYKLPKFDELNLDFEIDKIDRETDFLLRVFRKVMMEKVVNSLQFLDMLLNPGNAPRIYYSYIKSMEEKDREIINKLYGKLGQLSLDSLYLEIDNTEEQEAELIKEIFKVWKEIGDDFKKILGNVKKPQGNGMKKEKNYFG
jgi:hypothetical protein